MCFSLAWLVWWAVRIVILIGVVMILRIVVPWVLELLGVAVDPRVFRIINIIIGIVVICWLIWFIYDLIVCAGVGFPRALP
jgi:hypothetical protein